MQNQTSSVGMNKILCEYKNVSIITALKRLKSALQFINLTLEWKFVLISDKRTDLFSPDAFTERFKK